MRQAIVVIHGIGEQRPLDTIRGFAKAITYGLIRSKPDRLSESFELRRLALVETSVIPPTDVYELYWAHHMQRAQWTTALRFMYKLIFRTNSSLSPGLKAVHLFLWGMILLGLAAAITSGVLAYRAGGERWLENFIESAITYVPVALFFLQWLLGRVVLGYIGDAARYLTPEPENIESRAKIRAEGVRLLRELHRSRKYSRVVVVGHSLGSVIGYDVLRHLWDEMRKPSFERAARQPEAAAFDDAVDAVNEPPDGTSRGTAVNHFQQAQHRLWRERRQSRTPWLVTDFVTLGSPLAHARILLENRLVSLEQRKLQRELPTCPPTSDEEGVHYLETHDLGDSDGPPRWDFRIPNHGAAFSGTRWTNLYFPHRKLILGDVVGGPLAPVFGLGVRDVPVRPSRPGFLAGTLKSHVLYWEKGPEGVVEDRESRKAKDRRTGTKDAILALRSALQLEAKRSKEPWPAP